jgi:hypothetical protein
VCRVLQDIPAQTTSILVDYKTWNTYMPHCNIFTHLFSIQ